LYNCNNKDFSQSYYASLSLIRLILFLIIRSNYIIKSQFTFYSGYYIYFACACELHDLSLSLSLSGVNWKGSTEHKLESSHRSVQTRYWMQMQTHGDLIQLK